MAKARMLSIKVGSDPDLNSMSIEADMVFMKAIPHLDRDGLIIGDPVSLWAKVNPRRVEIMDKMPRIIQEWIEHGLVIRYEWKDGAVLFFPGFRKHNQNLAYEREPESEFPPPPGWHRDEDKNGVSRGLIPNDPELAGRLAQNYDKRSSYHAALTEASKDHEEIGNSSGSPRDNIPRKNNNKSEVEQQTEVESEVENNNSALQTLTLAEAEKAVVVVGAPTLIGSLDDDQTMALLSWLWLYNGWHEDDLRFRDLFRRGYERDPFAGMKQPGAVMVKLARDRSPAPLNADDRVELAERLRAMQEPTS